ncbi:MAG: CinA family nicotinamide mononucleotide deamidase-related protein [Phycisphaerales bacterium]
MADRLHTHAAILSTGDELVMGQLQDTNARWLAERLTESGVRVVEAAMVGDDLGGLVSSLRRLAGVAPVVIMSGGLGATDGDLTRQAVCEVTGDSLVVDEQTKAALSTYLASRGRAVTERQLRQAMRPSGATPLFNAVGTAPGLHAKIGEVDLLCLPGPPGELRPMWRDHVAPRLRPDPSRGVASRLLYVVGIPEADAADVLRDLTSRGGDITVNLTASGGVLTVRARAEGMQTDELRTRFERTLTVVRERLRSHIVTEAPASDVSSNERLCAAVLDALKARGEMLSTVESCTGGMLGQMLTAIPGSSAAYLGGLVTYSNALKSKFASVSAETIETDGAVSKRVAAQMAVGGLRGTGATYTLSITGIAGPDGGSVEKPVGTVWIGLACAGEALHDADVRCFRFTGDRNDVRIRACTTALIMLVSVLRGQRAGRLLWQHVP